MEYIHKYIQHNYRHPVNAVSAAYFDAKIHPPSGILKDQTRIHRTWVCEKKKILQQQKHISLSMIKLCNSY